MKKELELALIYEGEQIVPERLAPDETPPGSSHAAHKRRRRVRAKGHAEVIVSGSTPVHFLRMQASEECQPQYIELWHNGKQIPDGKTLAEAGVPAGASIYWRISSEALVDPRVYHDMGAGVVANGAERGFVGSRLAGGGGGGGAAKRQKTEEDGPEWACGKCTTRNRAMALACQMCGSERE